MQYHFAFLWIFFALFRQYLKKPERIKNQDLTDFERLLHRFFAHLVQLPSKHHISPNINQFRRISPQTESNNFIDTELSYFSA